MNEERYFEFIAQQNGERTTKRLSADSDLTAVVEAFQEFLLGAGFVLEPGYHLDLVEDET